MGERPYGDQLGAQVSSSVIKYHQVLSSIISIIRYHDTLSGFSYNLFHTLSPVLRFDARAAVSLSQWGKDEEGAANCGRAPLPCPYGPVWLLLLPSIWSSKEGAAATRR